MNHQVLCCFGDDYHGDVFYESLDCYDVHVGFDDHHHVLYEVKLEVFSMPLKGWKVEWVLLWSAGYPIYIRGKKETFD